MVSSSPAVNPVYTYSVQCVYVRSAFKARQHDFVVEMTDPILLLPANAKSMHKPVFEPR